MDKQTYQQPRQQPQNHQSQSQLQHLQQQQMQQQFQEQDRPFKPANNANNDTAKRKPTKSSRKRSLSSSSTSSSGSPFNRLFSTASSSDSGLSSMTSSKGSGASAAKRKRPSATALQHTSSSASASHKPNSSSSYVNNSTTTNTDSSSGGDTSSSSQMHSTISSHKSLHHSPGAVPPRVTAQRSVPAFLNKLYNMVEDTTTNDLIRWSKDGTSFIVEKHEEFAKTVLPHFYKHNTFASFVRQLNMYDFHKVPHLQKGVLIAETEHEIWEFSNPHFQRGRPDLLVLVTRKRNRDKDANDSESVSISTLVQDLQAIKKQQSVIGAELRDLHRDNEILWQETLTAREKYQRHQEAIEKILQFLTVIFASNNGNNNNTLSLQNLAITMNNDDSLPKGLIEEAAYLAGMSTMTGASSSNNKTVAANDGKGQTAAPNSLPPSSLTSAALSNILSSVLRLYSTNSPPNVDIPISMLNQHMTRPSDKTETISSTGYNPSLQSPSSAKPTVPDEKDNHGDNNGHRNIVDFSKTLSSATRSAQSITQDIDMLQVNIESLANNLGIDPSQFDDDLEASTAGFQLRTDYRVPANISRTDLNDDNSYSTFQSTHQDDLRQTNTLEHQTQPQGRSNTLTTPTSNHTPMTSGPPPSMNQYGFRLQQPPQGRFAMNRNQQQFRASNLQPQTRPQVYGIPSPSPAQLSFQPQQHQRHMPTDTSGYAPMAQQDFMSAVPEEPVLGPPQPTQTTDGYRQFFNTASVGPMNYSLPTSYGGYDNYAAPRNETLYGHSLNTTAVNRTGPTTSPTASGGGQNTPTANQRFQSTTAYFPPQPHQMTMTDDNSNNNQFYAEGPTSFHNATASTNHSADARNNMNARSRSRRKSAGKR